MLCRWLEIVVSAKQLAAVAIVFAATFGLVASLLAPAMAAETKEQACLRQGDYYRARGANSEASQYYLQAVKLAPGDFVAHRDLADNMATQKKYKEALSEVNVAIGLNPKFSKLYVERGLYNMGLGKTQLAEADFEKAVASPDCGHAVYKYLGDLYKSQGRLDQAIALCDLHIKRDPSDDLYRAKAEYLIIKKDYAGARQALTVAIGGAPFNYRNYELRADACLAAGLAKEAVADYSKALSLEPYFTAEIYQNRARAYAKLGQKDLEQKDIKSSLAKD